MVMILFVFCCTQHSYRHNLSTNKVTTLVKMVKVIVKIVTTSNTCDQACFGDQLGSDEGLWTGR